MQRRDYDEEQQLTHRPESPTNDNDLRASFSGHRVSRSKLRCYWMTIIVAVIIIIVLTILLIIEHRHAATIVPLAGFGVAKHVLLIGLDGFGGRYYNESVHPTMDGMRTRGVSTLSARNNVPCESKPNWASILTGATPEENGMESNYWYPQRCDHYGVSDPECIACRVCGEVLTNLRSLMGDHPVTSLNRTAILNTVTTRCIELKYWNYLCVDHAAIAYDHLADHRTDDTDICATQSVPQWNWPPYSPCRPLLTSLVGDRSVAYPTLFGIVKAWKQASLSSSASSLSGTTLCYHDWDSIFAMIEDNVLDYPLYLNNTDRLTTSFERDFVAHQPTLSFMYYGDIDEAGHEYGWGSDEYHKAIHEVDGKMERVLAAVRASGVADDTIIMVIADHGARRGDYDHGIITDDDDIMVPYIINGPRVHTNSAASSLVRVIDVAPTLLHALGIPSHYYDATITGRVLVEHFY